MFLKLITIENTAYNIIPLGDVAVVIITGGLLPAPFEAMIVIV